MIPRSILARPDPHGAALSQLINDTDVAFVLGVSSGDQVVSSCNFMPLVLSNISRYGVSDDFMHEEQVAGLVAITNAPP
jgi:hypothetical protein